MKNIHTAALALLLACNGAPAQIHKPNVQIQQERLMGMEEQWMQAVKANRPAMVAPLLSETFIQTQSSGRQRDKKALLDSLAESTMKWQNGELSEMKVDIYGSAAVVTGRFRGRATRNDKLINIDERWTDTWIRQDGGWKCVASHASDIPQAEKD